MQYKTNDHSLILYLYENPSIEYPISLSGLNDIYVGPVSRLHLILTSNDKVSRWAVHLMTTKNLNVEKIMWIISVIRSLLGDADTVIEWKRTTELVECYYQ
ncbi:MAG: hypothetical protein EOO20_11780 [Chryseobacterium sp.]|nr:MAG: hypothetical protein EOO20_11780 [Chryseobacterium sp.]